MAKSSTSYTCKNATSFKPGHQMFDRDKLGCNEYWTEEKIQELIVSLGDWVQKDDSISMAGWRGYNTITQRALTYVRDKSPIFREVYECARQIVANRLANKTGDKVHSSVFNMLTPVYDWEVKAHQIEMATLKSHVEDDKKKNDAELAYQTMRDFMDQVKSNQILR